MAPDVTPGPTSRSTTAQTVGDRADAAHSAGAWALVSAARHSSARARKSPSHKRRAGAEAAVARRVLCHATGGPRVGRPCRAPWFSSRRFSASLGALRENEEDVVNDILALLFGTAPVMLALVWRNAIDRRRDDADTVTATARAAIAKALGGESLVAVRTDPPTPWSHGRVHLTAPDGYWLLVDEACLDVAQRLPLAYDLVIHGC